MENTYEWARQQFGEVCLGDKRRTQRAVKMADQMACEPFGSLPKQMKSWEAQKGAYRLLDNGEVSHHQLSEPHWRHTREAAGQAGSVILMVQDFTDLNYTNHPATQGLGPISSQAFLSGLWVHNTLAIQPQERRVLGLAYQQVWAREERTYKGRESKTTRRKRSNRQSLRWGQAVAAIGNPPDGVKWVYVADREADMFEFFENILSMGADFCIRLVQERRLADWTVEQAVHLLKTVRDVPAMGQRILDIPASPGQAARQAQLAVSWQSVTLRSPRNTPGEDKSITAWAVRTWEKKPATDVEPIEWLLITSVPVQSLPEALERIEWYTCRWIIEEYHRCLKQAARWKNQLRHAERFNVSWLSYPFSPFVYFNCAIFPDPLPICLPWITLIQFSSRSLLYVLTRNPTISRWASFGLRLPNLEAFRLANPMAFPAGSVSGVAGYISWISRRASALPTVFLPLIMMWVILRP
jgi:hypothetical protein